MLAFLQQLLLFTLFAATEAAPVFNATKQDYGYHVGGGVVGFIVLVLDIIVWSKFALCILHTRSPRARADEPQQSR